MKVTIVRGGGIAGMTTRTQLDSDALAAPDADALSSRVQAAALHEQAPPAPADRSPDATLYEIAVDDAGAHVVHRFTDDTLPEPVRQLVEWVDHRPERSDSIE